MNDQFNAVNYLTMVELIEINQRYLLDKKSETDYEICVEMRKHLDNLFNSDIKVLYIKSPYGISKTQLMIKAIEEYKPKRILMLSYRQTSTLDLKKNFELLAFEDFITGNIEADRVIVQLEILYELNCEEIVKQYDLVLIDESERVLNHFSSRTTFNGREGDTFEYLYDVLRESKNIICLNGGRSNRTYNYMSHFGKTISVVNKAKLHENGIHFMDYFELWTNEIIEDFKFISNDSQSKTFYL